MNEKGKGDRPEGFIERYFKEFNTQTKHIGDALVENENLVCELHGILCRISNNYPPQEIGLDKKELFATN